MNKEPRLRFTDEERADPALEKPIRKADKAAAKADKAQAKIPKKKVRQKTVDPETSKVTTKLVMEDKKKPPSKLSHAVRDTPANAALGKVHKEIRETEQDNVGVESAHKSEEAAETGARLMREGYRSHKFLQRTIEIQQQMEALRQSKAQIASEDYNPGRLDMEAIEAALCEAVEMHDGLVSEDFIDLFVSQVTPLSDSRFAWCLDFSPQPTVAFLNLAGQRKYTTCSMDSKLHFGPFADGEEHTIPFPGSLRR